MFKMNNFLSRFYFFSKLTTSLVLLIILFLISYLFIKAYLNKNTLANDDIKLEELSLQLVNLSSLVRQNSDNINIVKDLVLDNKQFVNDIILNVNEMKKSKINDGLLIQINKLSEENQELNDKLNKLVLKFNNINEFNQLPSKNQQSFKYIRNLVNLIRLKLDSGTNFIEEVELLQDLQLNIGQLSHVEKLSILAIKDFSGLLKLNGDLKDISSDYLQNYYLKKNKNRVLNYLTKFVSIEPNSGGSIQDTTVYALNVAKQSLLDKKVKESINQFSSLPDGEYFFSEWIKKAEYYIEVTNILNKLLN